MSRQRRTILAAAATGVLLAGMGGTALPVGAQDDQPPEQPVDTTEQPPAETTPAEPAPEPAPPAPDPEPAPPEPTPAPPVDDVPSAQSQAAQDATGNATRDPRPAPGERAQAKPEPAAEPEPEPAPAAPTPDDPTYALAVPGAAPIGVPSFFIEKFRIPPFLLPIYQAAGIEYGIRWEILAAINEIETDYGRNLNVSSAGALGWMQFMPATWEQYGTDGNRDGRKDPYNPVDAIFAAARYLKAAGGAEDLRRAIFAYNHADWYVESVLMRARLIAGLPADLVGSLTGLTQGRFPVDATARYARRGRVGRIYAAAGSPVVAAADGKVVGTGENRRLGRWLKLRDVYGNTYTYARLGAVVEHVPVPRDIAGGARDVGPESDATGLEQQPVAATRRSAPPISPDTLAPVGRVVPELVARGAARAAPVVATAPAEDSQLADNLAAAGLEPAGDTPVVAAIEPVAGAAAAGKERLFANPSRPRAHAAGGAEQLLDTRQGPPSDLQRIGLTRKQVVYRPLRRGTQILAGTRLARLGAGPAGRAAHLRFQIRPAGRGAPTIDPKPILDGWKLLESTAIYRANGRNALIDDDPTIGQILLLGKPALQRRVLADRKIELYECGRQDIASGIVDRRVLATLAYLSASGMRPTVSSLRCGHGYYTASGNVSHHSSGNAVDISAINGIPILGNQGPGSVTDLAIRELLELQGTMRPAQIISLIAVEGATNTLAMSDHHDHIHVGWPPLFGENRELGEQFEAVLKPGQWHDLLARLAKLKNPVVPATEP